MTVRRAPYSPERRVANSNNSAFAGSLGGQVKSAKPVVRKRSTAGSASSDDFLACSYVAHYKASTFLNTSAWPSSSYNPWQDKLPKWSLVYESGDLSLGPRLTHAPTDLIAYGETELDVLLDTPDRAFEFAGPRRLWLVNLSTTFDIPNYSSADYVSSTLRIRDSNIGSDEDGVFSDIFLTYPTALVEVPFVVEADPGEVVTSFKDYLSGLPLLLGDDSYFQFIADSTMLEPTVSYDLGIFCLGAVDGSIQTEPNLDYDLLSAPHPGP